MNVFEHNGQKMTFHKLGEGNDVFIWAHGWGTSYKTLEPLAQSMEKQGVHYLIDFPGFGDSPIPEENWNAQNYADFMQSFIESLNVKNVIWCCHSFGSRIGLRLAASTDLINKMIIIGGHGVPPKRSFIKKMKMFVSVKTFKFMKLFVRSPKQLDKLRAKFGSADYKNAGAIRPIFMNIIRDDVTEMLPLVSCPVLLMYGEQDTETPPEMGQRISVNVQNGFFKAFPDYDHYTILTKGQHQVASQIKKFIGS